MSEMFRRISRRSKGLPNRVFPSQENLAVITSVSEDKNMTRACSQSCRDLRYLTEAINSYPRRIAWQDEEATRDRSEALTEEWMKKWQVPLVLPFGRAEFKHRVEAVKSAILVEMDQESARDMRKYNLADCRSATCTEMISSQVGKAASKLGILGF